MGFAAWLFFCSLSVTRTALLFPRPFLRRVEDPFNRCLQAADAHAAAVEWESICNGLKRVNACLLNMSMSQGAASPTSFFFYGGGPTAAEAATAPTLFRMLALLPAVRCEQFSIVFLALAPSGSRRGTALALHPYLLF